MARRQAGFLYGRHCSSNDNVVEKCCGMLVVSRTLRLTKPGVQNQGDTMKRWCGNQVYVWNMDPTESTSGWTTLSLSSARLGWLEPIWLIELISDTSCLRPLWRLWDNQMQRQKVPWCIQSQEAFVFFHYSVSRCLKASEIRQTHRFEESEDDRTLEQSEPLNPTIIEGISSEQSSHGWFYCLFFFFSRVSVVASYGRFFSSWLSFSSFVATWIIFDFTNFNYSSRLSSNFVPAPRRTNSR